MKDFDKLLDTWENQVRAGQAGAVRAALAGALEARLPRAALARYAQLAWRTDVPELGARALNPVVRREGRRRTTPEPAELAEYAACLVRLGAVDEALRLLEPIPSDDYPAALLYRAFCHVSRWDYGGSLPLLRRYVDSREITDYQRLVGRVNLSAALVYEKVTSQAEREIETVLRTTRSAGFRLLHGNALELKAQLLIGAQRWEEAESFLRAAESALHEMGTTDLFFVRKWRTMADFSRAPRAGRHHERLAELREQARAGRLWEMVRQCDRLEAVTLRLEPLACLVYFGTPYPQYRDRLARDLPGMTWPAEYVHVHASDVPAAVVLDVTRGVVVGKQSALKDGQAPHRLLRALAGDLYRPTRLAALHAAVYPGEHFNPVTSPGKVLHVLWRLRDWLRRERVPVRIETRRGFLRLVLSARSGLLLVNPDVARPVTRDLEALARAFGQSAFAVSAAERLLCKSRRTAQRLLTTAVNDGLLIRDGAGAYARYRFPPR